MGGLVFTGSFTRQEPIPEAAIEAAERVLRSGRLHRYNTPPGETSETAALEVEFAASVGARYCLACASGGYALQLALRAWGVRADEPVATNAFTLSPVPGAIVATGARPVLIETGGDLTIDLAHLDARLGETGARLLLLSHMRGHIADMEALLAVLARHGAALIEDCAHTMGASWGETPTGRFGAAGCFSTQTYKHVNSGEGGLLVTDDPAIAARAVTLSGAYHLHERHLAAPGAEAFAETQFDAPNMSGRMDDLRAAILRPQIADLARNAARWNERYAAVAECVAAAPSLALPARPAAERHVASSIQFFGAGFSPADCADLVARCMARGVELKWFGAPTPLGYTSRHVHWRYVGAQSLPATDAVLATLFDMRLPLTFSLADCRLIGRIIAECAAGIRTGAPSRAIAG